MLISRTETINLLRCPRSGCALSQINEKLIADFDGEIIEYDITGDCPVLVDHEQSLLSKQQVTSGSQKASAIKRHSYSGITGLAKRIVSRPKKATAGNVDQIARLIFEKNDKPRVLIVGGASVGQGMNFFYENSKIELVSFDIYESPFVQFIADAHHIPLPDEIFDAVIIQAVLEHVLVPERVVSEIHRVLKADGVVYAETPFLQHVHEGAYDFTRYTESGHRYLFKNFALIKSGASAGAGTQLLWSIDNFFRGLFRSRKIGKSIKLLFFWLQYCDAIIPDSYNIDSASGVYFLGLKQNFAINPKDIILHYKGAQ